MQIRRPLCLLSLVYILLLTCCIYGRERPREPLPKEGEKISLTGIVINKEYRVMYGSKIPVLYVSSIEDKNDRQVMCYMTVQEDEKMLPYIGETVRISGKASLFRRASNPGEFDLREYYQILNISYKLNQAEILERSASCFLLKEKLFQFKCYCSEMLEKIYPAKEASILKAMMLGEKSTLEEETKELYQLNGLIHILSISGLHVSLLGMAVSGFLKKCRVPVYVRIPSALAIMWCYGSMTGMAVSTWRAIFMFALRLISELLGRTYDMLTALSLAAVLMLTEQSLFVLHSGFLLSFGAVLGVSVILPWWSEILENLTGIRVSEKKRRDETKKEQNLTGVFRKLRDELTNMVIQGFCLSTAIAVMTLPILFYFYYVYPFYSLLLNLYVIPLMSLMLLFGMVSLAAGFFLPEAALFLGMPDRAILWLYEISCKEALELPGALKIGGRPEVWQLAVYYGVLFFLVGWHNLAEEKKKSMPAIGEFLLVLGIVWVLLLHPFGGFMVSFLDVGQGDCMVMRNENGHCYMVDGGSSSKSKVGKYQMLPFLESQGIGELEAVFLTHPDEDHISGVIELMEQSGYGVKIKSLILPDVSQEMKDEELFELRKSAAEHGVLVYYIGRGDVLQDGKLKFTCLGPEKGFATDKVNEISTVLYTEYEEFKMLLTGDVVGEAEKELLSELESRETLTVLKVAHHGSKHSTPPELLQMTNPVYAIISAGKDNRYGHPHEELMERLKRQACHIYQTPESGAVTMWVRRGRIRVEEFLATVQP